LKRINNIRYVNFWNDFKEFVLCGNVYDLAVGLIIGSAFTTIVNSLVDNLLKPPIGLLVGGNDFPEFGGKKLWLWI
jgi:large conductance mechanosensitive channel